MASPPSTGINAATFGVPKLIVKKEQPSKVQMVEHAQVISAESTVVTPKNMQRVKRNRNEITLSNQVLNIQSLSVCRESAGVDGSTKRNVVFPTLKSIELNNGNKRLEPTDSKESMS